MRKTKRRPSDTISTRTGLMVDRRPDITLVEGTPHIDIGQLQYPTITTETRNFNQKLYSAGAATQREVIECDPASPYLRRAYQALLTKIKSSKSKSTGDMLSTVLSTTRAHFPSTDIDNLVASRIVSNKVIPLEVFMEEGKGVCRHHALLNVYFLSCLVREQYLTATTIVHHRQNISGGNAHTWVIVIQQKEGHHQLYSVDSMWNLLVPVNASFDNLPAGYGSSTKMKLEKYLPQKAFPSMERPSLKRASTVSARSFFTPPPPNKPAAESQRARNSRPCLSILGELNKLEEILEQQRRVIASKPLANKTQEKFFSGGTRGSQNLRELYAEPETILNAIREKIESTTFSVYSGWILKGGVPISYDCGKNTRVPHSIAVIYRLLIEHKYHRLNATEAIAQIRKIVADTLVTRSFSRDCSTTQFYSWIQKELPPEELIVIRPS